MSERRTTRWPLWLKVFWFVVGGAIIGLWSLVLLQRVQARPGDLHDFVQEWTSARNHFENEPIYADLRESIPRYLNQPYDDVVQVNAHPPTSILISLPFGLLPYRSAYFWWNVLSLAALLVSAFLLLRELRYSLWALLPLGALLITSNSLAQQVNQGQLNLLLLLLATLSWLAWRRDAWQFAGILVGLMTAIKIFPGFLVLFFLARRNGSAVAGSIIGFLVATALTGAVLGFDCYRDYVFEAAPQVTVFRDYWPNASAIGFWSKLLDPQSGHVETVVQLPWLGRILSGLSLLTIAGLTAWVCLRAQSAKECDLAWATALVGMLLAAPITWDHYFLLLTPVLLIQWRHVNWPGRVALLALVFGLLTVYPKWIWDVWIPGDGELATQPGQNRSIGTPLQAVTLLSYQFYLLAAWFTFSIVLSRTSREASAVSEPTVEASTETPQS